MILLFLPVPAPAAELDLDSPDIGSSTLGTGDKQFVYTARLRQRAREQGAVEAAGIKWRCSGKRCTAKGPWPKPGVPACNALAKKVGPVQSYGHRNKQLSRSRLKQCNRGVKTAGSGGSSGGTIGLDGTATESLSGAASGGSATGGSLAAPEGTESITKPGVDVEPELATDADSALGSGGSKSLKSGSIEPSLSGSDAATAATEPQLDTGAATEALTEPSLDSGATVGGDIEPEVSGSGGFSAPEPGDEIDPDTALGSARSADEGGLTASSDTDTGNDGATSGGFTAPEATSPSLGDSLEGGQLSGTLSAGQLAGMTLWDSDRGGQLRVAIAEGASGSRSGPPIASQGQDCDDSDRSIKPGAAENCNGRDDDCDGVVDEDVRVPGYKDKDRDGAGSRDPDDEYAVCPNDLFDPEFVATPNDCDDNDPDVQSGC